MVYCYDSSPLCLCRSGVKKWLETRDRKCRIHTPGVLPNNFLRQSRTPEKLDSVQSNRRYIGNSFSCSPVLPSCRRHVVLPNRTRPTTIISEDCTPPSTCVLALPFLARSRAPCLPMLRRMVMRALQEDAALLSPSHVAIQRRAFFVPCGSFS